MKYYSMPADFKQETIAKYAELNKRYKDSRVFETYGNITDGNFLGSGRLVSQMSKVDWLDLHEYIKYSRDRDIDFSYTINPPFIQNMEFTGEGVKKIKDFLIS